MSPRERQRAERSDAKLNRERLLDAAQSYYAELGINAPWRGVAERAGLGGATMYRHFPTHEALIRALYDRIADGLDLVAERCARAETAWQALEAYLDGALAVQLGMPIAGAVLRQQAINDPTYRPGRRYEEPLRRYVAQAIADGDLRPDVRPTDVAMLPFLLSAAATLPEPVRSVALARQRMILLDGIRNQARERAPLPGSALDADQYSAMMHRQESV